MSIDNRKYIIQKPHIFSVPSEDVSALLKAADGNCALLYLHILASGGELDEKTAARDLSKTEREVSEAAGRLHSLGLISAVSQHLVLPAEELTESDAEDIALSGRAGEFEAVVVEAQRMVGKMLSRSELQTLFGIFDQLSMPAEVILMLINHSVLEHRERSGGAGAPSMKRIEKEAYIWANRGIDNLDLAEEYIHRQKEMKSKLNVTKSILQIRDRNFSPTERAYVENWLDLGFEPEAIGLAYDRTVVKTGSLQWKYMNTIILNWHQKGIYTVAEILNSDRKRETAAPSVARSQSKSDAPKAGQLEQLKKILEKVTNS